METKFEELKTKAFDNGMTFRKTRWDTIEVDGVECDDMEQAEDVLKAFIKRREQ